MTWFASRHSGKGIGRPLPFGFSRRFLSNRLRKSTKTQLAPAEWAAAVVDTYQEMIASTAIMRNGYAKIAASRVVAQIYRVVPVDKIEVSGESCSS